MEDKNIHLKKDYVKTAGEVLGRALQKFGFKLIKEALIPETYVNLWFMLRDIGYTIKQYIIWNQTKIHTPCVLTYE